MDKANRIAEVVAGESLESLGMRDDFIGAGLENILIDRNIKIMYKNVKDSDFFGMAARGKGFDFIGINTYHNQRTRLIGLAHELWHLMDEKDIYISTMDFDSEQTERAADRFAAALMLPREKVKQVYNKGKGKNMSELTILYQIADFSLCPYEAVYKRFDDLGLSKKEIDKVLKKIHYKEPAVPSQNEIENKFIELRKILGMPDSIMDKVEGENAFPALEQISRVSEYA